jgi:uncharacterized surface protein with fasciclin (FAS1) repeats
MMRFLLACTLLQLYGACADSEVNLHDSLPDARSLRSHGNPNVNGTLDFIIENDANLTTLLLFTDTAELLGVLCTTPGCNFTLFAPTNEAFLDFNQDFLALLLTPSWILHLQNFVAFHVTFPSLSGDRLLTVNFTDGEALDMLNNEAIVVNILNGAIALTSPLTSGAFIIKADILATNGAVNYIDSFLVPGYFGVDVFALGYAYTEFTMLQQLFQLSGLAGTEGEYTVLAPTNDAFLALDKDTFEALKNDMTALRATLANHVIVDVYPSIYLTDGLVLIALSGLEITVSITNPPDNPGTTVLRFNDATVIFADILARNGIAHAIDTVLLDMDFLSHTPSMIPSEVPSAVPSYAPSIHPTETPSAAPSASPSAAPVRDCTIRWNLYDSKTDRIVAPLTNNVTIANPPRCGNSNIEAVLPCRGPGDKVILELWRGAKRIERHQEGTYPYFLFGNSGRNVKGEKIAAGTYGIRAKVSGTASFSPFTNFTLGGSCKSS